MADDDELTQRQLNRRRVGTTSRATPVLPSRGNPFSQGSYQWRQREAANARAGGPAAYRAYRNAQAGETSDVGPGDGGRAARRGYAPGTTTYDREAAAFIGAPRGSTIGQVHDFTRAANAARMFDPVQAERARLSAETGRSIEDIIRNGITRPTAQPVISSSVGPAAQGSIRPPSTGSGGLMQIPGMRDFATIAATGYESDLERAFYLSEVARRGGTLTPDAQAFLGSFVPDPETGRTLSQIRGTEYQSQAERDAFLALSGGGGATATMQPGPYTPPTSPTRVSATPQIGTGGSVSVPDYNHGGRMVSLDPAVVAAIQQVFPPNEWNTAYHIVASENGGQAGGQPGLAGEIGAFQIHPIHWPSISRELGIPINAQTLTNPVVNAQAAKIVHRESKSWNPWTTHSAIRRALGY